MKPTQLLFTTRTPEPARWAMALGAAAVLTWCAPSAQAQSAEPEARPAADAPAAKTPSAIGPERTYRDAVFLDTAAVFVPYVNDIVLTVGLGVRIADIHELWARAGYILVGDDGRLGVGNGGYRVALRPGRLVRPLLGVTVAGLAATCGHNASGQSTCTPNPLFILAGQAGVRFEPRPWLGVSAVITLGSDSVPNIFGMAELGLSFALPQSEAVHAAGR